MIFFPILPAKRTVKNPRKNPCNNMLLLILTTPWQQRCAYVDDNILSEAGKVRRCQWFVGLVNNGLSPTWKPAKSFASFKAGHESSVVIADLSVKHHNSNVKSAFNPNTDDDIPHTRDCIVLTKRKFTLKTLHVSCSSTMQMKFDDS